MAQEITLGFNLALNKSGVSIAAVVQKIIDQSGANNIGNTQNIGTTTEQLTFGDVATPGYIAVVNLDTTNFLQIGLATPVTSGNAVAKLLPGEGCLIPTRQTTWYALADTAAVNAQVVALDL